MMMTLSMIAMIFEQGDCASPDWRSCQEWCLAGSRINAIDVRVVSKLFQNFKSKVVSKLIQNFKSKVVSKLFQSLLKVVLRVAA